MRIAVVGGTGQVGRHVVEVLQRDGHEPVVISRSRGIDVATGDGLDEAVGDVDVVVDVTSTSAPDRHEVAAFFEAETTNLLAAERHGGIGHHVLLSILNLDAVEGNAHYAGKRRQEELVRDGSVPWTIVRAAQFFEFAEMVVGWTRAGDTATVPPLLLQPIAAADVGAVVAEVAVGAARHEIVDLAGPESHDLVDMTRRILTVRGDPLRLVASWRNGPFGTEMAGEVLLPGPGARLSATTFDTWLATIEPATPT